MAADEYDDFDPGEFGDDDAIDSNWVEDEDYIDDDIDFDDVVDDSGGDFAD
jgi:hypothetical protein